MCRKKFTENCDCAEEKERRNMVEMTSTGTQAASAPSWWNVSHWNFDAEGAGDWIPAIGLSVLMLAITTFFYKNADKINLGSWWGSWGSGSKGDSWGSRSTEGSGSSGSKGGYGGFWGSSGSLGKENKTSSERTGSKADTCEARKKKLPSNC